MQLSIHNVKWATSGCCLIVQIKALAISAALRPDIPSCQKYCTVLANDFSGAKVSWKTTSLRVKIEQFSMGQISFLWGCLIVRRFELGLRFDRGLSDYRTFRLSIHNPFCHHTTNIKALQRTQSTNPNQCFSHLLCFTTCGLQLTEKNIVLSVPNIWCPAWAWLMEYICKHVKQLSTNNRSLKCCTGKHTTYDDSISCRILVMYSTCMTSLSISVTAHNYYW